MAMASQLEEPQAKPRDLAYPHYGSSFSLKEPLSCVSLLPVVVKGPLR